MANETLMVFKADQTLNKKDKSGTFRLIELHDPATLENTSFYIEPGKVIETTGLAIHDKVRVTYSMGIRFGKPTIVLDKLVKINN